MKILVAEEDKRKELNIARRIATAYPERCSDEAHQKRIVSTLEDYWNQRPREVGPVPRALR